MIFRKADIKDIPVLNEISVFSKAHWGYPKSWIENRLDELTLDHKKFGQQHILTAEDKGKIIGFVSMHCYGFICLAFSESILAHVQL